MLPAPGALTCSSQWQKPKDTGWIHPRDYKPQLVGLTLLTWVGKLIQIPRQERTEAHWEVKDLHEVMGTDQGRRPRWSKTPKHQQNENTRWDTLWEFSTQCTTVKYCTLRWPQIEDKPLLKEMILKPSSIVPGEQCSIQAKWNRMKAKPKLWLQKVIKHKSTTDTVHTASATAEGLLPCLEE